MNKIPRYLQLDREPDPDQELICTFNLTSKLPIETAAEAVADESSVGTWTTVSTMEEQILTNLGAKVTNISAEDNEIQVIYPQDLFESGNIAQILSCIAGNIFGMKAIQRLKLIDTSFPPGLLDTFDGPELGVEGVQRLLKIDKPRPILGTIIKPKVGLNAKRHAEVAYEAFRGGIDFVKDDENLSNQRFCPFDDRVVATLEKTDQIREETGREVIYAANISASSDIMLKRAEFVKEHGGTCIMIDFVTVGYSSLQFIRSKNFGLAIHGHRAMHAALDRTPDHGISMMVLAKFARLGGVDLLHTGTVVGKMEGEKKEIKEINKFLQGDWSKHKSVLPVASGGLHPGFTPRLYELLGPNMVFNYGGGCHGHPDGTRVGAVALAQSLEASIHNQDLFEYAKDHPELAKALEKWKNTSW
ncbi:MAG: ribulose-bisphosphate carboxylase large subunit [Candidatus Heimdallarchaeota archaeon]